MTRLVVAAFALLAGCKSGNGAASSLRLGFFPTVTHGAALVALERGTFAAALAPVKLEEKPFRAGPEAMEALLAGAIDASYVGSVPALNAFLRSNGEALSIVAGAAEGGAAFVIAKDANITGPESLHGKKIASPQLGNTQDIALRAWLREHNLKTNDKGGDVQVLPLGASEIVQLMRSGGLDGAWVPEPTVSRLVHEAGARVFLDEKLGQYPTAVLVVTKKLQAEHPEWVEKLVAAHVESVKWIQANGDQARELCGRAILKHIKKALPPEVMNDAWARVSFTSALPTDGLKRVADDGRSLGVMPAGGDVSAAADGKWLQKVAK
jgi:NitT/TauT family transport system substrate-binding protein